MTNTLKNGNKLDELIKSELLSEEELAIIDAEIDALDADVLNKFYMKRDVRYKDNKLVKRLCMKIIREQGFRYISHLIDYLEKTDPYLHSAALKKENYKALKMAVPKRGPFYFPDDDELNLKKEEKHN